MSVLEGPEIRLAGHQTLAGLGTRWCRKLLVPSFSFPWRLLEGRQLRGETLDIVQRISASLSVSMQLSLATRLVSGLRSVIRSVTLNAV